jgi:cytidylate kinase
MLGPVLITKMRERFDRERAKKKKESKEGTLKDQVNQKRYEEWYLKHSNDVKFSDKTIYTYQRKM